MKITGEMVEYVAKLSRLKLTDDTKAKSMNDLNSILDYMDILQKVDTDGIEPLSHTFKVTNAFHMDVVEQKNEREILLSNAPEHDDEAFIVPKTVE